MCVYIYIYIYVCVDLTHMQLCVNPFWISPGPSSDQNVWLRTIRWFSATSKSSVSGKLCAMCVCFFHPVMCNKLLWISIWPTPWLRHKCHPTHRQSNGSAWERANGQNFYPKRFLVGLFWKVQQKNASVSWRKELVKHGFHLTFQILQLVTEFLFPFGNSKRMFMLPISFLISLPQEDWHIFWKLLEFKPGKKMVLVMSSFAFLVRCFSKKFEFQLRQAKSSKRWCVTKRNQDTTCLFLILCR